MFIKENLISFNKQLPKHVLLVAVSNTKPVSDIKEAYDAGQRVFGENKIQEMVNKYEVLPEDIQWHMIGHLQSNKIKYMAHFVDLIHGVDSLRSLKEIDKQAKKHLRIIKCLLQVKIAKEDSKFGLSIEDTQSILSSEALSNMKNLEVVGLMGMASFTSDMEEVSKEFSSLKSLYDQLNKNNPKLTFLSM